PTWVQVSLCKIFPISLYRLKDFLLINDIIPHNPPLVKGATKFFVGFSKKVAKFSVLSKKGRRGAVFVGCGFLGKLLEKFPLTCLHVFPSQELSPHFLLWLDKVYRQTIGTDGSSQGPLTLPALP
ncbi:MAG: hypothetical protein J6B71_00555, partial [Clostridia bacterium]|nr:hypothetical protein [Clostridia bacterium]